MIDSCEGFYENAKYMRHVVKAIRDSYKMENPNVKIFLGAAKYILNSDKQAIPNRVHKYKKFWGEDSKCVYDITDMDTIPEIVLSPEAQNVQKIYFNDFNIGKCVENLDVGIINRNWYIKSKRLSEKLEEIANEHKESLRQQGKLPFEADNIKTKADNIEINEQGLSRLQQEPNLQFLSQKPKQSSITKPPLTIQKYDF